MSFKRIPLSLISGMVVFSLVVFVLLARIQEGHPRFAPPKHDAVSEEQDVSIESREGKSEKPETPPIVLGGSSGALYGKIVSGEHGVVGATIRVLPRHAFRELLSVQDSRGLIASEPVTETSSLMREMTRLVRSGKSGISSEDGSYEIDGPFEGELVASVRSDEGCAERVLSPLHAGERRRVDFTLASGWFIDGNVIDELGNSVLGAQVRAWPMDTFPGFGDPRVRIELLRHMALRGNVSALPRRVTSDHEGRFRLGGMNAIHYCLSIEASGYISRTFENVPAGTGNLRVVLQRGGRLFGKVTTSRGVGIVQASVRLEPRIDKADAWFLPLVEESTRAAVETGSDGTFEIVGLRDGRIYDLFVEKDGFQPISEGPVDITERGTVDIGALELLPSEPIQGAVLAHGDPVAGAKVRAVPSGAGSDEYPLVQSDATPPIAEAYTDRNGVYELRTLPSGAYDLEVWTSQYAAELRRGVKTGSTDVNFDLSDGLDLRGRVIDAADRSPIEGARVDVGSSLKCWSDEYGEFTIRGLTRTSKRSTSILRLVVDAPMYRRTIERIHLTDALVASGVELLLERGIRIEGTVVSKDGVPVAGATLRLIVPGVPVERAITGQGPVDSVSGEDGSFLLWLDELEVEGFARAPEIVGRHPEHGSARSGPLIVGDTTRPELRLSLSLVPGASISGKMQTATGEGVADAEVALRFEAPERRLATMDEILGLKGFVERTQSAAALEGYVDYARSPAVGLKEYVDRTRSGPNGIYRFEAVLAGSYVMDVARVGYAQEEVRIEVRADADTPVDVVLTSEGKIAGRVTDLYGNPVAHAEVLAVRIQSRGDRILGGFETALANAPGILRTRTRADGEYVLTPVPREPLVVVARALGFALSYVQDVIPDPEVHDLDFELSPNSVVGGSVVDAESGLAVESFQAGVSYAGKRAEPGGPIDPGVDRGFGWNRSPDSRQSIREGDGEFLFSGMPPGPYLVWVRADDFAPFELRLEVVPGSVQELMVSLERGSTVWGTVVDSNNDGVEGAVVAVATEPTRGAESTHSRGRVFRADSESTFAGRFQIRGIPTGTYRLKVTHPFHLPWESEPVFVDGGFDFRTIPLKKGALLDVQVLDLPRTSGGHLVLPQLALVARSVPSPMTVHSYFRVQGSTFRFYSVAPGTYDLRVSVSGYQDLIHDGVKLAAGVIESLVVVYRGDPE